MKEKRIIFLWFWAVVLIIASIARAERLPVRVYTTADGLANDSVNKIVRDSRGFLWFCTSDGLARFDGFEFKNYGQNEGLPHPNINDFLETKNGDYLVATNSGIAIFNPNGKAFRWNLLKSNLERTSEDPPMFRTFQIPDSATAKSSKSILSLTEDRNGQIFAGTLKELFKVDVIGDELKFSQIESKEWSDYPVFSALKFDAENYLWIAARTGVYRMSPEGKIQNLQQNGGSILIAKNGEIWIGSRGTSASLRVFGISADGTFGQLVKTYSKSDGLSDENLIRDIKQTADGRIFVIAGKHLNEFLPDAREDEAKFRVVEDGEFLSLQEDQGGNLWLGTAQEGAWKVSLGGFIKYDQKDGAPSENITSIGTDSTGNVFLTAENQNLSRFDGSKFETVQPFGLKSRNVEDTFLDFQAIDGDWWIPSRDGLLRYTKTAKFTDLANTPPRKIYDEKDGLISRAIFSIFQDSSKNIWISTSTADVNLNLWDSETESIRKFTTDDGLPKANKPVAFCEDKKGSVWFGYSFGGLARYQDEKFQFFTVKDGVPESTARFCLIDKIGRLWIATASKGIFRVDNPADKNPVFTNISTAEGMSSNLTNCLIEDEFGHIYVGTGRGINRIDPLTGNIKLFTQSDGLPGSVVQYCTRDKTNALWFVSQNTPVKFIPQAEQILKPSPVFIGAVSVNGINQPISELGAETIENLEFGSDQQQIRIDFFALGFNAGDRIRYQYKLGDEDWHAPEDAKSVNFNLAPGDYAFYVRAVNADNVTSENPAIVSFKIATPFWRRWWFLMLAALIVAAAIFALDRFRVKKTKQVENALEISRESAERFRTLAQTASDGIITVNKNSRIVFVNDAVETIFGYSEAELIGADLTILMPNALQNAHHAGIERYMETNEKHISWTAIELPGKHKSGGEIPLELSFGEFTSNGERYFTGIARDVSERKKADEALRHAFGELSVSENRFRQLNEQSPLGTIIFAPDGSIRAVNQAYENFWGITFDQIKDWDFFADEQLIRIGVIEKLKRVFKGEIVHFPPEPYDPQDNNHGIEFDGEVTQPWFESFAYPVKNDDGELLEVILVMEDVTDSKRAEEIEQKAKTDRLRELEQVRRRIAADLHDDIGSSLTQISIFSEVLQQRVDKDNAHVLEPLEFIAGSSRELVDAMSDIVWAINPNKDFLGELTGKMHRFAADVFTARDIKFTFDAPNLDENFALGANLRREIFLIFKESVNNIVKHAKCKTVEIKMKVENSEIHLSLHDDGAGFQVDKITDGHGLVSMKQRAAGLGGTLRIFSGAADGTTTILVAPLTANADGKI